MRLAVVSHKVCWPRASSPTGFATDGGFAFQMRALADLFDATTLVVPCSSGTERTGEVALAGRGLSVAPLHEPVGRGVWRKLAFPIWLFQNLRALLRGIRGADVVHAPIPGDVGTVGIALALLLRKRLFVRHCGNWFIQRTSAERFWKWLMERVASPRHVMFATGGAERRPSSRNTSIAWIFATTLTKDEITSARRVRSGYSEAGPRLIVACRQDREKGTGVVIESLPLILRTFPRTTLEVVGDGDALPEFRQIASALGVSGRVRFHGKLDHAGVLRRLAESDLFCYPTQASDGFPKAVLEALACGLPVVTTRVSVLPQLVGSGCGVLLDEVSASTVAEGVRVCLEDIGRYREMSAAAVATAAQYSLERWGERIRERLQAAWGPLQTNV